ncbi:MAG: carbon monoxide dehydrogenase subunit G [Rhodospirillales bacterium]|nr:carbon monoxide dehydrogenase subunit G [Rhodospirillales bacterium]
MKLSDEIKIEAPRERVFAALNDPEVLKRAIPGCQALERMSASEMTATVTAKIGPVKATFKGRVTLSDLNPPESYTIAGEGKGGAAGFAKGSAKVTLTEDGAATRLRYEVNADVGGKLAQVGARLIEGSSKKLAQEFFAAFKAALAAPAAAAPEAKPAAGPAVPVPAPRPAHGLPMWLWVGGVAFVVALIVFLIVLR